MNENVDRLKREIVEALKGEQWGDALPLLEQWCEHFPTHSRSWLNRGYCLIRLGRSEEAVAALDRCLELDPGSKSAKSWRNNALAALDQPAPQARKTDATVNLATENAPVPEAGSPATYATMASPAGGKGWLAGTVVNGRYEVMSVARGGMAVVAISFDRELRRMVAVKTPLPSVLATEDGRTRFQREAESWIALGVHPNICSAYYLQEIGGMPRLFVEYVDGGDLGQWLKGEEERSLEEKLDIAIQVASGLDYTHNFTWTDAESIEHKGLIHRDIKPANVLLTSDGIARVTDFGLVRVEGGADDPAGQPGSQEAPELPHRGRREDTVSGGSWQTVTVAGGLVGTPPYMAPELWMQALRGTVASDVYAFGCMLYEIFCGRRPFVIDADPASQTREANLGGWMRMHLHEEPVDPTTLVYGLEPRLGSVLKTCVAKDAGRRPQSFRLIRNWLVDIYGDVVGRKYPRPEPQRTQLLADSLNNRAVSYITLDLVERARAELRAALDVDPRHLDATFNSSLLEWRNDGLTDAEMERRLGEAERATGNTARAGLLRAYLRLLIDDPNGAVASLREIGPDSGSSLAVWRELGLALAAVARAGGSTEGLEEGRNLLAGVLEQSPSDLAVVLGFAEICGLLGDEQMADEAFRGLKKVDQDLGDSISHAVAGYLPGHRVDRTLVHQAPVQSLLVLSDGRVMVRTAAADAMVWDPSSARPGHSVALGGPARQGRSMAVDGNSLVVCLENGPLTLFDLTSWERLRNLRPHPGVATCIAASPDEGSVATGGSDRCLRLWELDSGECVRTLQGHAAFISAVLWHPSTVQIVTASADSTLRVWNLEQGRCEMVLEGHRGPIRAIAFDDEARRLASAGQDGSVGLWDLSDGSNIRWLRGHRGAVTKTAFVDGSVVAGGEDGTVRLWHAEDGRSQRVIRLANPIQDLARYGARRIVVAHGTSVSEIEIPTPRTLPLPLVLSDSAMSAELAGREAAFGNHLETARRLMRSGQMEDAIGPLREARKVPGYELHSEALALWGEVLAYFPKSAVRSVVEIRRFACGPSAQTACAVASNGTVIAGDGDGMLRFFDSTTGTEIRTLQAHPKGVTSLGLNHDGQLVASAGRDGVIRVWNTSDGAAVREFVGHQGTVHDIALTSRGEVASAGEDGTLRLWPLDEDSLPEMLASGGDALLAVCASEDGRYLVSAGWDSQVTVWSLRTRAELRRLEGHAGAVNAIAVSADCRVIASAGEDGTLRLWDLEGGRCWRVLSGHEGGVQAVAFTPDARFLVTAGKDSTLRLWDHRTGGVVKVVEGHAGPVADVALDRDGGEAVTAGIDASSRLWFLDWEPEQPERGMWDDRVRPFLEVFIRRCETSSQPGEVPTWTESDLRSLLEDLGRRGFGWLVPERVERELENLARNRDESRSEEQLRTQTLAKQRQREQRTEPAKKALEILTRNLGLKLAGIAVLAIVGVVALTSLQTPQSDEVEFNQALLGETVRIVEGRGNRLRLGAVFSFQEGPTLGDGECSEEAYASYLATTLDVESRLPPDTDPGAPAEDEDFRASYADAVKCAGMLGDPTVVDAVLERAPAQLHAFRLEDLLSVLVRNGDPSGRRLTLALDDYVETVRHMAALTLVYKDQPWAREELLDALYGDETRRVEAGSYVLSELICIGAIDQSKTFETVRQMCRSIDPRVRRNAVRALVLFERTGLVADLLDETLVDNDPQVVVAAERTREIIRSAKIQQIFGAD